MERDGEKRGGDKVPRFRGNERTEKVLTDKAAPAGNEEVQGEERVRSERKANGEESSRGKDRVSNEKGRDHRRGRGKERAWEEHLPQDEGGGRIDKGRDKALKPSEGQATGEKSKRGQGKRWGVGKLPAGGLEQRWSQEQEQERSQEQEHRRSQEQEQARSQEREQERNLEQEQDRSEKQK
ncbi:hypothetical protein R6Z07F_013233 [Ovis aries]